jgi:hypothetical protein
LRVSLAAAIGAVALVGCADCPPYDDVASPGPSVSLPRRASGARTATPITRPETTRQAAAAAPKAEAPKSEPLRPRAQTFTPQRPLTLKPHNEARFLVLPDVEAIGRSRSYTGEPSDPNACAERCLASTGCDAFSFERETKICFLVSQVTELAANSAFVSGRLR